MPDCVGSCAIAPEPDTIMQRGLLCLSRSSEKVSVSDFRSDASVTGTDGCWSRNFTFWVALTVPPLVLRSTLTDVSPSFAGPDRQAVASASLTHTVMYGNRA
jgi:hypothetical protein